MQWDRGLLNDQKNAASHIGDHTRLLAGPGTGKTLTLVRRVAYLVTERGVSPEQILALTFTRAAAFELRKRIAEVLGSQQKVLPRISTLHSFALRQLLRNSSLINSIPQPLRIADDWEERNIILEDFKDILSYNLKTVREKFNLLSADWQTLNVDEVEWENRFPDPRFLGAWRQHREVFGYTLRSELVYQLKQALEQTEKFSLDSNYLHLLVDEYQDLNRCDLAVIYALRDMDIKVFVAGDDDQSIYGFRYAHPEGIRRFDKDYVPSSLLTLETCVRCDRSIIDLSLFVANLDPNRLPKKLKPRDDAGEGEVHILRFADQLLEANGVATICRYLLDKQGYDPNDILILMRSDSNNAFSSVIRRALEVMNVPVAVRVEGAPLDTPEGRTFLSVLRLLTDKNDSLALRTLLTLRCNQIGEKSYSALYNLAHNNAETFSNTAYRVMREPKLIPRLGRQIANAMQEVQNILNKHQDHFESLLSNSSGPQGLIDALHSLANDLVENTDSREKVLQFLESTVAETNSTDHRELLRALSSSLEDAEQELDSGSVNIMTMHKAKGLTASAVIIIAAEDEYIPGRQIGKKEDDERRLLYVSLTRARHFLVVTYCDHRIGQQKRRGRTIGKSQRTLTRFLVDTPIRPADGANFVKQLKV